jgi:hypothetical protein
MLLQCFGELARPAIKLFLQMGGWRAASARNVPLLAALELGRLVAGRFHGRTARCGADLASGHAIHAIDLTSDQPLMKPSHNA